MNATRQAKRAEPKARPARPRLSLSVQIEPRAGECPVDRTQFRRWARSALLHDAVLTLRLVGTAEARTLNAQFRGRDYATNVLTFDYLAGETIDAPGAAGLAPLQADIVVCLPVVAREARAQRKSFRDHLAHLVVHGVLHAQGMDHETDEQAQHMEAMEVRILRRFGIANPYG